MGFLRKLSGVKWWQKLSNVEVVARCDIEQISTMLNKTLMQWAGHMVRMGNTRLPMKIYLGGLVRARDAKAEDGHAIRGGYLQDGNC